MRRFVVVALACATIIVAPSLGFAGAPKCRANDPAAAVDADAVKIVRQQIDTSVPCARFLADGKRACMGMVKGAVANGSTGVKV